MYVQVKEDVMYRACSRNGGYKKCFQRLSERLKGVYVIYASIDSGIWSEHELDSAGCEYGNKH